MSAARTVVQPVAEEVVRSFSIKREDRIEASIEIVFETISVRPADETLEETMQRYVTRLEFHCRRAPYNWFNFYDFWA